MTSRTSPVFLKWAGGKRSILSEIHARIPQYSGKYIEPFLGGGSVLFSQDVSRPKIVSDANEDLINAYKVVRDFPVFLISQLSKFPNTPEKYYEIRAWDRELDFSKRSNVEKAARFIYLNKTCFNGLYRVNSKGQFNVPFGNYKNPEIVNEQTILSASEYLNQKINGTFATELKCADYKQSLNQALPGDFVYLDPPYAPLSKTEAFVSYTAEGFGAQEQINLRNHLLKLKNDGVQFVMSNSDTELIQKLYEFDYPGIFSVEREIFVRRSLGSKSSSRIKVQEVLVS